MNPQLQTILAELKQRLTDLYGAIAEAAALASPEVRAGEAVMLLNHLLALYGLTVARYLEAVGAQNEELTAARTHLRLVCRPFD